MMDPEPGSAACALSPRRCLTPAKESRHVECRRRAARAAVPVSRARAEASRRNGAKSRGPTTEEAQVRSAQNALRHGMRAQKHLALPDEDGAEFAAIEAVLVDELAPVGALQMVLASPVAVAAWRLA